MASRVFLALGSNIEERKNHILQAINCLKMDKKNSLGKCSSLYETKPYGPQDQNNFLNLVLEIFTEYSPDKLFESLKNIEAEVGRKKNQRWGAREIDIDILFYDNIIFNDHSLSIPHKDMLNRDFVLVPLNEIAPELIHPGCGKQISELIHYDLEETILRKITFSTE